MGLDPGSAEGDCPRVNPNTDLPIGQVLDEQSDILAAHHELVLEAAPGAGKTTQVPLALLNSPWLGDRRIIMPPIRLQFSTLTALTAIVCVR